MATSTDSNKGDEEVAANYAADGLEILFNSKFNISEFIMLIFLLNLSSNNFTRL